MNQTDLTSEYTDLRTYLLALAGRIAGYDNAEDVVQDGMVKAWEYFVLNPDASIKDSKAWLAGVVRNTAIDLLRRNRMKSKVHGRLLAEEITEYDPTDDIFNSIAAKRIIMGAGLTAEEIYIIEQAYLTGRTYLEIGTELDLSTTTIKRKVARAREKLANAKDKDNA